MSPLTYRTCQDPFLTLLAMLLHRFADLIAASARKTG